MKIVLIGTSGHYGYALKAENKAIRFTGIAPGGPDEDITSSAESITRDTGADVYTSWQNMLDELQPDAAVVCPHFHRTAEITIACLKQNIHVFAEKPLALSLNALDSLEKVHKQSDAQLVAMHPYRYDPVFKAAYSALEAGLIGEPLLLTAQKSYKLGERPDFYRNRQTYGGTIPWVGSHSIDWLYWFSGGRLELQWAAHSRTGNRGHNELEMTAACGFTLSNGGQAITNIDYCRPAQAATHGDDRLRIAGDKGVLEIMQGTARLITADTEEQILEPEPCGNFFDDFIVRIQGTGTCRLTTADCFEVTRLCLRARDMADRGRG